MHLGYPSRGYKRVHELEDHESRVDLVSFLETDEVVHADTSGSEVVEFFKEKSVLITGGTGFIGKLLTEKLLRSCKNINKIYLLIRQRRNKDMAARTREIIQNVVFTELRKVQPDFHKKIVPVYGDMVLPHLGLNDQDQEMLRNNLNVIFHVAATVKLEEKLRVSAQINVAGTLDILNLARTCRNISSFVYVSTAYSNSMFKEIEEKLYRPPIEAEELLNMIKYEGENIDHIEESITGKFANSYITTKKIAEYTMKTHAYDLPVCIVRPAIVTNTHKEPLKRYIDNFYGSIGVVANKYAGIMRTTYADREKLIETVPADYVVNACIVAAYKTYINGPGNLKIYNYVSSSQNPITIGDVVDLTSFYGHQTPTIRCLWYPCGTVNKNYYCHMLYTIFLQFLPAFCYDSCLRLIGQKPWMFSVYEKIHKFTNSIHRFASNEWKFSSSNTQHLWEELSEIDKKVFPFNMSKDHLNWNEYLSQINLGVRLYLLNDNIETINEARRKHKKLYYLHVATKGAFTCLLLFLIATSLKHISRRSRAVLERISRGGSLNLKGGNACKILMAAKVL